MRPWVRCFGSISEVVGFISAFPIAFFVSLGWNDGTAVAIISKNTSPDGLIAGVVLDCWQQLGFGLQGTDQYLIVHLARPEEERILTSTIDSCETPETAMLAISTENLKNRPLLHWVSSKHLNVMIPDGSVITIFNTNRDGIIVDFIVEKTADQKQQRLDETSGEPDDLNHQTKKFYWYYISVFPFFPIESGVTI